MVASAKRDIRNNPQAYILNITRRYTVSIRAIHISYQPRLRTPASKFVIIKNLLYGEKTNTKEPNSDILPIFAPVMKYIKTEIEGVYIIEPRVFNDARGYFFEAFKKEEFETNVGRYDFVQDNESKSSRGVLRGLHYQAGEYSQAKLVRVIKGTVVDVAVDLRRSSPTFGRHVMVELSDANKRQLFIPRGFAHGFLVLSDEAIFTYKVDNVYAPEHEASIRYDDPDIAIAWPMDAADIQTSPKDRNGKALKDAETFD